MITYLKGDIFNSPAKVLVNAVNTVGVMGKGVALEFKKRYPEMFSKYQKMCANHSFSTGKLYLWKGQDKWVLLFPTKQHWRNPSKIEYIEAGLQKFVDHWQRLGIDSIAFPRLGCGNGNLDWDVVRPVMEKYLKPLPIQVYIYIDNYHDSLPEHKDQIKTEEWLHSSPDVIGFNMLKEELQQLLRKSNIISFADGTTKKVIWEEDNLKIINGEEITIPDIDFCNLWDYVRSSGVFSLDALPQHLCSHPRELLEILKKLDYLQDVILSKNGIDFSDRANGYQYIRG